MQQTQSHKIVYSMRVMTKLVERGFFPVHEMPNPKNPEYRCWVFNNTKSFEKALLEILGKED